MPRDTLTADQIVRAAIELLDAEGLDGLNMRSLGTRLDSAATAMYWHVKSKDNLVRLAGDAIWDEIELPDLDGDWRAAAATLATGMHEMMTRHPWLVQALASHVIYGPHKSRFDNHTLTLYEQAGFSSTQADQASAAVFTYVLGNAVGDAATVALMRRLRKEGTDLEAAMAEATEIASQFPMLRARIGQPAAEYNASPADTFEIGLTALLNGLNARFSN